MGGKRQRDLKLKRRKRRIEDIQFMSNQFLQISDVTSLIELLNVNKQELISLIKPQYVTFQIKKGKKGLREINQPTKVLLNYQRKIVEYLNCIYLLNQSNYCYSYTPSIIHGDKIINKNIFEASKKHTNKAIILKVDIKNFFQSITKEMVGDLFQNEPFHFNSELTEFLTISLTHKNSLPTGSPTSPILSNLIFKPIDDEIAEISNDFNYTRYSDDLTFSFDKDDSSFAVTTARITNFIEESGFKINTEKTQILKAFHKQEINGLVVNKKVNINRKYYRALRAVLHSIELDGISEAAIKYTKKNEKAYFRALRNFYQKTEELYISEKLLNKIEHHNGREWFTYKSITAKIGYFGFVRGKKDKTYLNLKAWFHKLKTKPFYKKVETPRIDKQDDVVYVTNATSNSIVYYAYVFLTNLGFDDKEIDNLRVQYLSEKGNVDFDKIRNSFVNQSVSFINLYSIMRSSNNFEKLVDDLIQLGRFEKVFKFNSDKISLIRQFNRKVFHDDYSCSYMRSDYEEDKFHGNTGVFSDELIKQKFKGYMVEKKYLLNLGMRLCKKCNEI